MRALLFSGGLDSTAIAFWLKPEWAITFDYGQRGALGELRAARQISHRLSIKHVELAIPLDQIGTGDLSRHAPLSTAPTSDWWPCRNQQLLSLAAPWALKQRVSQLIIGCLTTDQTHGDASPDFIATMNALFAIQRIAIRVEAPAIGFTKVELMKHAKVPRDILTMAHSCHTGEFACGSCRACNAHRSAMEELGFGSF
jgi:7-cyano-7-deazaguanine synthase